MKLLSIFNNHRKRKDVRPLSNQSLASDFSFNDPELVKDMFHLFQLVADYEYSYNRFKPDKAYALKFAKKRFIEFAEEFAFLKPRFEKELRNAVLYNSAHSFCQAYFMFDTIEKKIRYVFNEIGIDFDDFCVETLRKTEEEVERERNERNQSSMKERIEENLMWARHGYKKEHERFY